MQKVVVLLRDAVGETGEGDAARPRYRNTRPPPLLARTSNGINESGRRRTDRDATTRIAETGGGVLSCPSSFAAFSTSSRNSAVSAKIGSHEMSRNPRTCALSSQDLSAALSLLTTKIGTYPQLLAILHYHTIPRSHATLLATGVAGQLRKASQAVIYVSELSKWA